MRIIFGTMVIFAIPVTIYEIITFNPSKWSVIESIIFKKEIDIMSYNVTEYVVGWFLMAYKLVKNGGLV